MATDLTTLGGHLELAREMAGIRSELLYVLQRVTAAELSLSNVVLQVISPGPNAADASTREVLPAARSTETVVPAVRVVKDGSLTDRIVELLEAHRDSVWTAADVAAHLDIGKKSAGIALAGVAKSELICRTGRGEYQAWSHEVDG